MKKLIIAAAAFMVSLAAYGQGSFAFNNRNTAVGIDAKVTLGGAGLDGDAYSWQLYGGAKGVTAANAQLLPGASGTFRAGNAAGYVNPPSGAVTVPGVAAGSDADIFMSVFSGATASGTKLDTFGPWTVTLTEPPNPPNNLPMGSSPLAVTAVPEPTTLALGALGLGALLAFRRRK